MSKKGCQSVRKRCKAQFPKDNVITSSTVLICQGLARKFQLKVSGRRNAFGMWQGKRKDVWQSGTTPSFAVHFRSNSHTMPNYRLPPMPILHETSCNSRACKEEAQKMMDSLSLKSLSRLAQRVQREATGFVE